MYYSRNTPGPGAYMKTIDVKSEKQIKKATNIPKWDRQLRLVGLPNMNY